MYPQPHHCPYRSGRHWYRGRRHRRLAPCTHTHTHRPTHLGETHRRPSSSPSSGPFGHTHTQRPNLTKKASPPSHRPDNIETAVSAHSPAKHSSPAHHRIMSGASHPSPSESMPEQSADGLQSELPGSLTSPDGHSRQVLAWGPLYVSAGHGAHATAVPPVLN